MKRIGIYNEKIQFVTGIVMFVLITLGGCRILYKKHAYYFPNVSLNVNQYKKHLNSTFIFYLYIYIFLQLLLILLIYVTIDLGASRIIRSMIDLQPFMMYMFSHTFISMIIAMHVHIIVYNIYTHAFKPSMKINCFQEFELWVSMTICIVIFSFMFSCYLDPFSIESLVEASDGVDINMLWVLIVILIYIIIESFYGDFNKIKIIKYTNHERIVVSLFEAFVLLNVIWS
jgi:hypothetical protein